MNFYRIAHFNYAKLTKEKRDTSVNFSFYSIIQILLSIFTTKRDELINIFQLKVKKIYIKKNITKTNKPEVYLRNFVDILNMLYNCT